MILHFPKAYAFPVRTPVCLVTKDMKETISLIPGIPYPVTKHINKPMKKITYA